MNKEELELFFKEADLAAKMETFAIPPKLLSWFLGKEGLYPFWLVFKAGIKFGKSHVSTIKEKP